MKRRHIVIVVLGALSLVALAMKPARFRIKNEKENVVSSRLEGNWQLDLPLTKHLFGDKPHPTSEAESLGGRASFKAEPSVPQKIPTKYDKFFKDKTIYMAGIMTRARKQYPFVLTEFFGNPHIVYFRERDGDPMGDAESFNVMLAPAKDRLNDLLFIGGDFNNQPFAAYKRAVDQDVPR